MIPKIRQTAEDTLKKQADRTEERIDKFTDQIKKEILPRGEEGKEGRKKGFLPSVRRIFSKLSCFRAEKD